MVNEMKQDIELSEYVKIKNRLHEYVKQRTLDSEKEDKDWRGWASIRELAKRYHLSQKIILEMVEDCDDLDLIVGFRTYSGYGEFDNQGDYLVEWYGEE